MVKHTSLPLRYCPDLQFYYPELYLYATHRVSLILAHSNELHLCIGAQNNNNQQLQMRT